MPINYISEIIFQIRGLKQRKGAVAMHHKISRAQFVKLQKKFVTASAIAKEMGICKGTVFEWRKKFNVPGIKGGRRKSQITVSEAQFVKLQKKLKMDSAVAKALGVSRATVCLWRRSRGIPAIVHKNPGKIPQISKTKLVELQKRLKTDSAIAAELGVSSSAIGARRKKWGIPTLNENKWNAERNNFLTHSKDQYIELKEKLGTDTAIAKKWGVSLKVIQRWRIKWGLPVQRKRIVKMIPKIQLVELQKNLKTDAAIAATLGVSTWTVWRWRQRLGIVALRVKK